MIQRFALLGAGSIVPPSFPRGSGALWNAIIGTLPHEDPAGSRLTGPAWPGQPLRSERGMFDLVAPVAPVVLD